MLWNPVSYTHLLLFTLASIWFVLIPCLIRGIPAIAVTVGVVAVTAAGALVLLNGFSLKTLCSVLGCVIGVVVAGGIAALVGNITPMNGLDVYKRQGHGDCHGIGLSAGIVYLFHL